MGYFKNNAETLIFIILVLIFTSISLFDFYSGSKEQLTNMKKYICGGVNDYEGDLNSDTLVNLGRFAVQQHNKNQNTNVEFTRVVKAKQQVVAGLLYYLTLEVADNSGQKKLYEAEVVEQPWLNPKRKMIGFKHVPDDTPSSDSNGH